MATTPVAPPAASAPPAAPAAPVSTPAPAAPASSTPTPAVPATPATPAAPQSIEERISSGWKDIQERTNLEEGTVDDPEAAPPVPDPAAPPAEVSEEVVNPLEVKPPDDVADDEFKLNLEEDTPAPDPAEFATKMTPEQKAFFDAHPDLKGQVFGALRRDAENREIRQIIPDVETARTVTKAAGAWQTIDNHFLAAAESPEGPAKFLDHWVREALETDDAGKPIIGEDGKYVIHPSLPKILDHINNNKIKIWADAVGKQGTLPQEFAPIVDALSKFAELKGDERLQAAVDVFREVMTPSSPAEGEIPDNLKPFVTSLKAKEKALNDERAALDRQQREGQEAKHFESIERAETAAATSVSTQLKAKLSSSGLTEKMQGWALKEIGESIDAAFGFKNEDGSWSEGSDPKAALFQSRYDSICQQPPGEAREKALRKHIQTYTNEIIGPIYSSVVKDAIKPRVDAQAERANKVDKQTQTSKLEPQGTSAAPSTPSAQGQTDKQLLDQVKADYRAAHNGEEPDRDYVIKEGWKRRSAAAAPAGR